MNAMTRKPRGAKPQVVVTAKLATGVAEDRVERIRARAFEIYRTRSAKGIPGDEVSDWLQAERDIDGKTPALTTGIRDRADERPTDIGHGPVGILDRGDLLLRSGS